MAMKLICGSLDLSTIFTRGRLQIVVSKQSGPQGNPTIGTETWIHTAYVRANESGTHSESTLIANMNTLKNSLEQNGGDLKWVTSTGAVMHQLLNGDTTSGTVGVRFEWLPGNPSASEGVARRSCRIIITGKKKLAADGLLFYRDTLTYLGTGGPRTIWRTSFSGALQPQTTVLETPVIVIQQGRAVGLSSYPNAATLAFDASFIQSESTSPIGYDTPPELGSSPSGWGVRWRYVFKGRAIDLAGATPPLP